MAALVYLHGGGFTYGTLDEFEVPMRLLAEHAAIVTAMASTDRRGQRYA